MEDNIKEQILTCLDMADEIERSGVIKDRINTGFRENLRYEMLKFLAYLSTADGIFTQTEADFVKKATGFDATEGMLKAIIGSEHLMEAEYLEKPPFALKCCVLADAGERTKEHKRCAVTYINTFRNMGQSYIACNDVTSDEEFAEVLRKAGEHDCFSAGSHNCVVYKTVCGKQYGNQADYNYV